jgi:RNA polymerase sigma-70 factor, ECF subfamily
VSHLRLVHDSASVGSPARAISDDACLDAFQGELDYVFRTLRRLGTAPSEVEDLAQEVFLALRGAWSEYDPTRPLRPYLFGISFRIASAHHRKRNREVALGILEIDDDAPGPYEALQSKQARALVLAALESIPLPRRAVLVMHDLDGVPVVEVAATLDIPVFTVYSRLRKARRELDAAMRRLLRLKGAAGS